MATKISRIFQKDKIVNLIHSAGTVSIGSGSVLSIGGLQYVLDAQKSVSLPVMTANTRYQIYAVISAGDVVLQVSTNENSVGPSGATSWKLVGSLYSNNALAFGAFLSVTEKPQTQNSVAFTPVITHTSGGITNVTPTANWVRDGEKIKGRGQILFTGVSAAFTHLIIALPTNLTFDTNDLLSSNDNSPTIGQTRIHDNGINAYFGDVSFQSTTTMRLLKQATLTGANPINVALSAISNGDPTTLTTPDTISWTWEAKVVGWTNTPIQDL